MTKLPQLKALKVIKALKKIGFVETRSNGSHVRLTHPDGRKISVAVHVKPIPKGTLKAILRQVGISINDLLKYL